MRLYGSFLLVIVYLGATLFGTVARNYSLDQQMRVLEDQIGQLQDERDTLSYQIQYDRTDSFLEREARAKLGLQLPGENVVILPKHLPISAKPAVKPASTKSNFEYWVDFLLGRSNL